MDGVNLQERAAARTQDLPGAELAHPFGDDWDVYKVRGKVFMLPIAVLGQPIVILKATPSDGLALRTAYEGHHSGVPHVQRYWITLHPDGALDPLFLDDFVTESYLLVVENLPKNQRHYTWTAGCLNLSWNRSAASKNGRCRPLRRYCP